MASKGNTAVTFPNGDIVLFDDEGDKIYQVHVLFESRGREAIVRVRAAFQQMFEERGARVIFGMVPNFRRDVKLLARWCGMKAQGLRWTPAGACELYVLPKILWSAGQ